jgi:ubiquinone/menaquinone biosynthesis C-methylase UbiE
VIETATERGSRGSAARWLSGAFDEAARGYDLMVALNPGYHRELATSATGLAEHLRPGPVRLLDLGCGSGASTKALLRAVGHREQVAVLGVDASDGMLARARAKSWPPGVRFERCLAQDLLGSQAVLGMDEPVDGVLAAYLFRNVAERDEVLAAVRDLLRPGGVLVVQDYSVAGSRAALAVWTLVCWLVVIPLSWLVLRQTRLYRYLWSSVRDFDSVQVFVDRLYAAGFVDVEVRTASGWQRGILHTIRARRPGRPAARS